MQEEAEAKVEGKEDGVDDEVLRQILKSTVPIAQTLPPPKCDKSKATGIPFNVVSRTFINFCRFAGRKMALK
jgi:hypothetical protein